MKHAAAAIAGFLALVLVIVVPGAVSTSASATAACLPAAVSVRGVVPASLRLDAEQQANARLIVTTAVARRLPTRAAVIAVAAALQESTLRNLPYGDLDSLGLFQQRPSQGWGDRLQVMDPAQATQRFLDRLQDVPGWPRLPLTEAAQAVQRSGFPGAYARWEGAAQTVVNGLLDRPPPASAGGRGSVVGTPGLLVLGDNRLAGIGPYLPANFQGGPVTVDIDPARTTAAGLAALRHRGAMLPGTLVVSLGSGDPRSQDRSFARRIDAVLRLAGPDRTVYWLTVPEPRGRKQNRALAAAARANERLQLIDASSAGASSIGDLILRQVGAPVEPEPIAAGAGCADGFGGYGDVPVADCTFLLPRGNPRSCQDAVRWGLSRTDGPAQWSRRCLNFVARAYGYTASGVPTAARFWEAAPGKHPGDLNPPPGALVFWATGDPAGHVALAAGAGTVLSNDIGGAGTISLVRLSDLTTRWGATYLGWAPPFFPQGI